MSFDLGAKVPLSITITDPSGALANAGTVALTITLPDGTVFVQDPVAPASTGVYTYDYATVQAGVHQVRWLATGDNASSYTDVIDVEPAEGAPFVSLADAKEHLRKDRLLTEDDEALRRIIGAACQVIEDRVGHVTPQTVVADVSACRGVAVLPDRPVISIVSVVRLPGGAAVPAADPLAGTDGYRLKHSEGVLLLPDWYGDFRVTTRVGRTPLPLNFRLAGLDLIKHLWQGSQHNNGGGRPMLGDSDAIAASIRPFALPFRVMELLGLKKTQERDEPLVG
ncbi:unnamed protein product [[Actinomadura] parvosata subsp. kistnae]|uniref:Bacterial Ig-like domain-containing protein n=1 Tax=[Actinomadura] parvosata subsp. kistnae TaxID=1909395 RepID=A0A1V0ABQ3_9ACTN|nr:hypothetical protein [Nonomuraea sp. ATCC 55076]AQZ67635.1 hypothetical protein BKM31_44760 [Nonomuraea sp. ATCC 55076]SPL94078.1 unnamed protein product [Actinomadura parvosata subsp. kistnae]